MEVTHMAPTILFVVAQRAHFELRSFWSNSAPMVRLSADVYANGFEG